MTHCARCGRELEELMPGVWLGKWDRFVYCSVTPELPHEPVTR